MALTGKEHLCAEFGMHGLEEGLGIMFKEVQRGVFLCDIIIFTALSDVFYHAMPCQVNAFHRKWIYGLHKACMYLKHCNPIIDLSISFNT